MVKVKEFCCGCSLRSGTFSIAWVTLMYNCYLFLMNVYQFLYRYRRFEMSKDESSYLYRTNIEQPSSLIFVYNVIRTIAGVAVSITALWALHKNKVKFLNGLIWYFYYVGAAFILDELFLIVEVDWEKKLTENSPFISSSTYDYFENVVMLLILYAFMTGVVSYFTLIVKSYRDYSMRNAAQDGEFVGPDATAVGYLAA